MIAAAHTEVMTVAGQVIPTRRGLLLNLFWTRTGFLLLLLALTAVLFLLTASQAPPGTARNLMAAVGTGALVSALLTFTQTVVTATASRQVLVDALVSESRLAMRQLTDEYRAMNREYYPTHIFEPTAEPNPELNRLLMADLNNTRQYFFRGFAARHAAARLLLTHSFEREMRVVIADPRDRGSINSRARYMLDQPEQDSDYQAVQRRLHDEICVGLAGLFVARDRCSRIDVTVMSNPPVDRFEVFDDSVWVTLFSDARGVRSLYPRTLRFLRSSYMYNMERSECLRLSRSRTAMHVHIDPATAQDEFLAVFEKITGHRLTPKRLERLCDEFHRFRLEFAASAELSG